MATATATLTVNPWPKGLDNTQHRAIVYGICALSAGGTYATNGIALNWGKLLNGNFPGDTTHYIVGQWGPTQTQPQVAFFFSTTAATGYSYIYDTVHNTLRIFNGGTELTNGAAITADTIAFEAEFLKNIG